MFQTQYARRTEPSKHSFINRNRIELSRLRPGDYKKIMKNSVLTIYVAKYDLILTSFTGVSLSQQCPIPAAKNHTKMMYHL